MSVRFDGAPNAVEVGEADVLDIPLGTGDVVLGAAYGADGYVALRYAAMVAWAHRRRLRVVRVVREVEWLLDPRPIDELATASLRLATAVLTDCVAFARSIAPDLAIDTRLVRGSLVDALSAEIATAGLLVLGSGKPRFGPDAGTVGRGATTVFEPAPLCPVRTVYATGLVVIGRR